MNIQNSLHPWFETKMFRGPYYSRRRQLTRSEKPLIRKLMGVQLWACSLTQFPKNRIGVPIIGFGGTPALAYRAWKARAIAAL